MSESQSTLGKAMAALEQALERDPFNGTFLYAMAALLALSGKLEQARRYLLEAEGLGVDGKVLRDWLSHRQLQDTSQ